MKHILKTASLHALAIALYVTTVASFLFYALKMFPHPDTVLVPIAMLMLLSSPRQ